MTKVIAIGNRLMQDDGIAVAVTENLRNRLENMGLEVVIGETDFLCCFHLIEPDDFVIIVDAAYTRTAAGTIHVFNLQEAAAAYGQTDSQHDMSIFNLMRLYSKPLRGYLIGIEIAETGLGCELSEALKSKFSLICSEVERNIIEIVKEVQNARYLSE